MNSAGDQVSVTLRPNAPDGDALTYFATNLPADLSLDPISGVISGTIANSAASRDAVPGHRHCHQRRSEPSQSFSWTVSPVEVTNPGDQSNVDGDVVSLRMSATDAAGP